MNTRSLRVWIVDDDPVYQEMLSSYLKMMNYEVRSFDTGEEMLNEIRVQPDVVILDHNLGSGLQGIEVLRILKDQYKRIHVVYLSGEDRASLVSEAYRNGSEDYIGKDSASLLRLKLRLEKISADKTLKAEDSAFRKKFYVIAGVFVAALAVGITMWYVMRYMM